MTESEWLEATDLTSLLLHLRLRKRPATSPRKLRLFACASLRHIDHLLPDERLRGAIAAVERFCDDGERLGDMRDARTAVLELQQRFHRPLSAEESSWLWKTNSSCRIQTLLNRVDAANQPAFLAVVAARALTTMPRSRSDQRLSGQIARWVSDYSAMAATRVNRTTGKGEHKYPLSTLRDIFGNPFRPLTIDSAWCAWNDGTVVKLAQAIYTERELPSGYLSVGRLAILADALEDAGCTNNEILAHCRGPGPHVQGCWVVDLLLGTTGLNGLDQDSTRRRRKE